MVHRLSLAENVNDAPSSASSMSRSINWLNMRYLSLMALSRASSIPPLTRA